MTGYGAGPQVVLSRRLVQGDGAERVSRRPARARSSGAPQPSRRKGRVRQPTMAGTWQAKEQMVTVRQARVERSSRRLRPWPAGAIPPPTSTLKQRSRARLARARRMRSPRAPSHPRRSPPAKGRSHQRVRPVSQRRALRGEIRGQPRKERPKTPSRQPGRLERRSPERRLAREAPGRGRVPSQEQMTPGGRPSRGKLPSGRPPSQRQPRSRERLPSQGQLRSQGWLQSWALFQSQARRHPPPVWPDRPRLRRGRQGACRAESGGPTELRAVVGRGPRPGR